MRYRTMGLAALLGIVVVLGICRIDALQAQSTAVRTMAAGSAPPAPVLTATTPVSPTWSPAFAQGLETLGLVTDIITDANGNLYMIGSFDQVQGIDATNIARWDGVQWHQVAPSSPPGLLTDIALYRGEVYVVTGSAYRTSRGGLWRYDAASQQWAKIGFPAYENTEQAPGTILDLAVFNDRLIVSGKFEEINGVAMPGIVTWDGAAFSGIAPYHPYFYATDLVLDPTGGVIITGSRVDMSTGNLLPYLGRWNGTDWQTLAAPFPGTIRAIAWENTALYAFNGAEIQRLIAGQWAHVSTVPADTLFIGVIDGLPYTRGCDVTCARQTVDRWTGDSRETVATFTISNHVDWREGVSTIINGAIYVGGKYHLADGSKHALLRYAAGALTAPFDRIVTITPAQDLTIEQGRLYAVVTGDFTGPVTASTVMTWQAHDGWRRWWHPDPQRTRTNIVTHLAVLGHDDLLIGGRDLSISPTQTTALARQTSAGWTDLDPQHSWDVVTTTVHSGTTLLAAGYLPDTSWRVRALEGGQWITLATDDLPQSVAWISNIRQIAYHQRLYALLVENGPSTTQTNDAFVRSWSGEQWEWVRLDNQLLTSMALAGTTLYLGNAHLYRDTGTDVERLATTNGTIQSILVDGQRIWIGGAFTEVDGVPARNIALWDGQRWTALGAGTNGPVTALAWDGTLLAISGRFTRAGDLPANGISIWDSGDNPRVQATRYLPFLLR